MTILAYETKSLWDGKTGQPDKWFLPDTDLLCGMKMSDVMMTLHMAPMQNLWVMTMWDFKLEEIIDTENVPWE